MAELLGHKGMEELEHVDKTLATTVRTQRTHGTGTLLARLANNGSVLSCIVAFVSKKGSEVVRRN